MGVTVSGSVMETPNLVADFFWASLRGASWRHPGDAGRSKKKQRRTRRQISSMHPARPAPLSLHVSGVHFRACLLAPGCLSAELVYGVIPWHVTWDIHQPWWHGCDEACAQVRTGSPPNKVSLIKGQPSNGNIAISRYVPDAVADCRWTPEAGNTHPGSVRGTDEYPPRCRCESFWARNHPRRSSFSSGHYTGESYQISWPIGLDEPQGPDRQTGLPLMPARSRTTVKPSRVLNRKCRARSGRRVRDETHLARCFSHDGEV